LAHGHELTKVSKGLQKSLLVDLNRYLLKKSEIIFVQLPLWLSGHYGFVYASFFKSELIEKVF
jgi:hypothetical protein